MIVPVPQFTTPAYNDRTSNNVQRMMNWFPEQTPDGWNLVSYPGYSLLTTAPNNAACRGAYFTSTGVLFAVHGNTVYEIQNGVTYSSRGTISTSSGSVSFADNGAQLLIIANGTNGYTLTISSGSPTLISDGNFPTNPIGAAFCDGYFIVCKTNSGIFYLSQLLDGTDWTPSQFATAEYSGDYLLRVLRIGSQIILFGSKTIEPWYNTGNASFPFERVNGGILNVGLAFQGVPGEPTSLATINETAFFVGAGSAGGRGIFEYGPGGLKKISTQLIESLIWGDSYDTETHEFSGYCYSHEGQFYYCLANYNNGGLLVYDITAGAWLESVSSGTTPDIITIVNGFYEIGRQPIAFNVANGKIYEIKRHYNTNEGTAISRVRIFGPIKSNSKRVFHRQIRIELEIAFDATGTTSIAPTLDWSDDGGLTYSTAITMTKTVTNTTTGQRVVLTANRLGSSSERYYRLTGPSNAAKIILKKCELDLQEGRF